MPAASMVDAQVCDHALHSVGISDLAHTDDAVFLAADGANLSLDGQAVVIGQVFTSSLVLATFSSMA